MSLINQMLSDLDSRQAFVNEKSDSALHGIQHTDVYEYEEDHSRPLLFFVLFSIILISLLVYAVTSISGPDGFKLPNTSEVLAGLTGRSVTPESDNNSSRVIPAVAPDSGIPHEMNAGLITGMEKEQASAAEAEDSIDIPMVPDTFRTGAEKDIQAVEHPLPMLTLTHDIMVSDRNHPGKATTSDENEEIRSLTLAGSEDGMDIDLGFSLIPDYSVFTLEDPARLVIELTNIEPVDTARFQELLPESVSLRTRHDENGSFQLILEFSEPFTLKDTVLTQQAGRPLLHIALLHRQQSDPMERESSELIAEVGPVPTLFPDTVVNDRPALEKKVRKEDLVRQSDDLYRDGLLAWRNGDVVSAMDRLHTAVASHAKNYRARQALVELLLEQGDKQTARKLLVDGLSLKPDHSRMAKLLAQLLAEEQNNRMALHYLQRAMPDVRADTEYHALVAALLQRENRHQEAIAVYSNTLAVHSGNGLWWMGLGISLEATGASRRALSAYRRALQDTSISSGVAKYLDSRISELNRKHAS